MSTFKKLMKQARKVNKYDDAERVALKRNMFKPLCDFCKEESYRSYAGVKHFCVKHWDDFTAQNPVGPEKV